MLSFSIIGKNDDFQHMVFSKSHNFMNILIVSMKIAKEKVGSCAFIFLLIVKNIIFIHQMVEFFVKTITVNVYKHNHLRLTNSVEIKVYV